ncbi:hypothetical protein [Actinoplanes sp. NPDC051411]|uniref:hypothetical protein n=1 Tax=Actinoplanes sp. NPDC051411 TaxID=3155522 RepID=UPI00341B9636
MIAALAAADFRERSRRPAYAVVLLAAVALGVLALPAADSHWQIFQLGDYRGSYSSAYAGTVTALAGAVWLSLAGFYVVKNAVALDVDTGVGQVLAATPLRRAPYLAGKFAGNLAVLASMTAALAGTALVMQLWRGEDRHVAPAGLLAPFVLITLPALALTAAAAVLFETVPGLRSGTGNIVWLFLWMTGSIGLQAGGGLDVFGLGHVITSMRADVVRTFHDHRPFDFGVGLVERDTPLKVFPWSGSYVDAQFLTERLVLIAIAVALAVLGAVWFHRFDPARAMPRRRAATHPAEPATRWEFPARRPATAARLGPAGPRLVRTSLRVLLAGVSRWWWAGTLVLSLIAAVAPSRDIAPALLPLCWVWPVLLWSRLGTQEIDVLAAYPHRRAQTLATWLAGVLLTAITGAVPLVRLLSSGDSRGVAAWCAGALFIPALAYLAGSLTRSSRPFQVLYLLWWYAILNGATPINFMAAAGPNPALVAACALALFFLTAAWRDLRHARR